jgi:hypothetical protein
MPHQLLQCRNPHLLISLMGAERMPQSMDADLFSNTGLFHVFGHRANTRLGGPVGEGSDRALTRCAGGLEPCCILWSALCYKMYPSSSLPDGLIHALLNFPGQLYGKGTRGFTVILRIVLHQDLRRVPHDAADNPRIEPRVQHL